jgi:hypothetical protein
VVEKEVTKRSLRDHVKWKGAKIKLFSDLMGRRRGDEKLLTWAGRKVQWLYRDRGGWVRPRGKQVKPGFA